MYNELAKHHYVQ